MMILKQRGIANQMDSPLRFGPWVVRPAPLDKLKPPVWRRRVKDTLRTVAASGDATVAGYLVTCQTCHGTIEWPDKPTKVDGQWARVRCPACRQQIRVGTVVCQVCAMQVKTADAA